MQILQQHDVVAHAGHAASVSAISASRGNARGGAERRERRRRAEHPRGGAAHIVGGHGVDLADRLAGRDHAVEHLELPRQLLAAAAGALERHQQRRLHLGAGAGQLGFRHALLHLAQLLQRDRHQLRRLALAGAGVDAEQARIHVRRGERVDRIDQPALLPHLLEQPRRHAAAEQGREQQGRVVVGIAIGDRGEAEHDMHLVEVARLAELAAPVEAGAHRRRLHARQVGEMAVHQVQNMRVLQPPRRGDHHVIGGIVPPHVAGQRRAREAPDHLLGAEHRPAHRLRGERRLLEMVEDDVVRRVVRLADLLQDHPALALQLLGLEGRVGQDVADDVGGERRVLLQHLDVVGGLLARGVGVDMPAHRLDLLGDLGGAAPLGALEGHVFEEMRDAVLLRQLVARAGGDVGAERDGLHPVHPLGHHGQAGGEAGDADRVTCGVGHAAFLWAVARTRASIAARSLGARV